MRGRSLAWQPHPWRLAGIRRIPTIRGTHVVPHHARFRSFLLDDLVGAPKTSGNSQAAAPPVATPTRAPTSPSSSTRLCGQLRREYIISRDCDAPVLRLVRLRRRLDADAVTQILEVQDIRHPAAFLWQYSVRLANCRPTLFVSRHTGSFHRHSLEARRPEASAGTVLTGIQQPGRERHLGDK